MLSTGSRHSRKHNNSVHSSNSNNVKHSSRHIWLEQHAQHEHHQPQLQHLIYLASQQQIWEHQNSDTFGTRHQQCKMSYGHFGQVNRNIQYTPLVQFRAFALHNITTMVAIPRRYYRTSQHTSEDCTPKFELLSFSFSADSRVLCLVSSLAQPKAQVQVPGLQSKSKALGCPWRCGTPRQGKHHTFLGWT